MHGDSNHPWSWVPCRLLLSLALFGSLIGVCTSPLSPSTLYLKARPRCCPLGTGSAGRNSGRALEFPSGLGASDHHSGRGEEGFLHGGEEFPGN